MVTVALSGRRDLGLSHSHLTSLRDRAILNPSSHGSMTMAPGPLFPFWYLVDLLYRGTGHSRKTGYSEGYKGNFCLWRGEKEKSFMLILKKNHLRNNEKFSGPGCPKKTKDGHMWIFNIFFLSFWSIYLYLLIPYIVLSIFLFFFSLRMKVLHVQLSQTSGSALPNGVSQLGHPKRPRPTWGRSLVPLHIWGQGDLLQLFILFSWKQSGLFKLCLEGKCYKEQK